MKWDGVHCKTEKEWIEVCKKQGWTDNNYNIRSFNTYGCHSIICIDKKEFHFASVGGSWEKKDRKICSFEEFMGIEIKKEENKMKEKIVNVLENTYNSPVLRRRSVPLFMSNPGMGKSTIIKEFAEKKGVNMKKLTLSQRMPNEVAGMTMPNSKTQRLDVYDSHELSSLNDGDILFIDEVFNGTLKQTLDAFLNILEDRMLPSGKPLANIMIVAASNPQGLINITPQIKERFIRYDLTFDEAEFQAYLKDRYGMPENISKHLCTLIKKEKFEHNEWNYKTPRSIEKAINQIGVGLESPYDAELLPFLKQTIKSPMDISSINIKKDEEVEYLELLKLIVKLNSK